jgi:hypothetical protein
MLREERLVYVQVVMTASVVYQLLALDLDPWFIKAVEQLGRRMRRAVAAPPRGASSTS